jgi:glycine betaine catabolism B
LLSVNTTLQFVRRRHEADDVTSFFFLPLRPLAFQAGQFIDLRLVHPHPDARGLTRPLSIASAPSEALLRLTTRLGTAPSTFKQALSRLAPGTRVEATGPYGTFVATDPRQPVVFIAGGIGITPFRSMLAERATRTPRPPTWLLYSSASPHIPFRPFFDALAPVWPALRIAYTVTRPGPQWRGLSGRIDAAFIRRHVADLSRPTFYVCGPSAFVDALLGTLGELGIPSTRVKQEGFPGYESTPEPACLALA